MASVQDNCGAMVDKTQSPSAISNPEDTNRKSQDVSAAPAAPIQPDTRDQDQIPQDDPAAVDDMTSGQVEQHQKLALYLGCNAQRYDPMQQWLSQDRYEDAWTPLPSSLNSPRQ
ncbi:hypothetical protein TWF506_005457 [Arthrobotrys conoides]|uniref:Uncharacterized protein n=1 Tax=Arthrobotrys conoides TaxID=74498 RepID=A0AAN8P6S1_9PEZI